MRGSPLNTRSPIHFKKQRLRSSTAWPWVTSMCVIAAILVLSNYSVIAGRVTLTGDNDSFFCPFYTLVADHARAARFLLWNPWLDAGSPDCAEPQTGAFSPVTWGFGLLTGGHEWGFRLYWLAIWAIGGLGVLPLARHLGAPAWGGCVAALAYSFSGLYTGNTEHASILYSMSFLPWIVWRLDLSLTRRALRPAIEAGAVLGLSALAGHPSLTITHFAYAGAWTLGRCAFREDWLEQSPSGSSPVRVQSMFVSAAVALAATTVVAAVVMSPTYTAFLSEAPGYTTRASYLPREIVTGDNPLPAGAAASFASPYLVLLQHVSQSRLWPGTSMSLCSIYLGSILPVFSLVALVSRPRCRWRWWLGAIALVSLGLAMGRTLPLRGWLYDLCPPTRYFRHPATFRLYYLFTTVALACHGFRDFMPRWRDDGSVWRRVLLLYVLTSLAALVAFAATLRAYAAVAPPTFDNTYPAPPLLLGWFHYFVVWVVPLVLIASVLKWKRWRAPGTFGAVLVLLAATDGVLTRIISSPIMVTTRNLRAWAVIERMRSGSLDMTPGGLARVRYSYDNADYKYVNHNFPLKTRVLVGYSTFDYEGRNPYLLLWDQTPALREMATGEDRTVVFSADAPAVPRTLESFDLFVKQTARLGRPPLVVHSSKEMLSLGDASRPRNDPPTAVFERLVPAQPLPIDLRAYEPNTLAFRVSCPTDGWLLVTDRWTRGWRVKINGEESEVWGGDYLFRAVRVRQGNNEVIFTYHPLGYPWLLILSWGLMAAIPLWPVLRRVRGSAPTPDEIKERTD